MAVIQYVLDDDPCGLAGKLLHVGAQQTLTFFFLSFSILLIILFPYSHLFPPHKSIALSVAWLHVLDCG